MRATKLRHKKLKQSLRAAKRVYQESGILGLWNYRELFRFRINPQLSDPLVQPFFIVGSGRSGNTLLRAKILETNWAGIPAEFYVFRPLVQKYLLTDPLPKSERIDSLLQLFVNEDWFKSWSISRANLHEIFQEELDSNFSFPEFFNLLYLLEIQSSFSSEMKYWGDKTPMNTLNLWVISIVFPRARYIHILRDGKDVINSYVKSGLIDTYQKAALRWINSCRRAREFGSFIGNDQYMEVRYEDLVRHESETLARVFHFLNIEPSDSAVNTEQLFEKMGDTTLFDHHRNVQKPIFTSSIGKWREEIPKEEYPSLSDLMASTLQKFNYHGFFSD